ncbi:MULTISPECIES: nitrogenase molybdenum-iron protein alpha chain [Desulfosporosinus]|uniref:Nitrogenase protein alpha chain n=2 Tax=Desulfosporosinus TaxID=79206 RepID=A0A1M5VE60_9FIRM|nr:MULTISPECIES: nitrogenase molybdenum-iron protein alpha chain [Desulfosporosinus]MDO0821910.1 nitrogenase molybdenum-iron protein alpha chain [Desulfosporosinus nitroreducens]SHH73213.1 nitrogenase molybdenum-iron protein alpha chain [Desulfosporosinus lacus DSM 15449]
MSTKETIEFRKQVVEDVLEIYPEKAKKNRRQHIAVKDSECASCAVKSNAKTVPGIMTARGCAYAGAKGVVWGPVKDVVHISHGPVGCGYYSWGNRRNLADGEIGVDNFVPFLFTSDFQESDIIYGGDKKLEKIIDEVVGLFPNAKGVSVLSECPVGLIGDDIESVARRMSEKIELPVIPVRCEGFRGISQSLGHHIANDAIRDHLIGKGPAREIGKYDIGIIGDYNIGGDAWASKKILEEMGLKVVNIWTGDSTLEMLQNGHLVKLNLIHCFRSMNYIAKHMEETYGTPWIEFNFFGPTKIKESILKIAAQFDDYIMEKALKVIEKYTAPMQKVIDIYRPRLEGKSVMLYVGGLRPRHIVGAYEDLGMEVIGTGYEFAHNEDYEKTIPALKEGTLIYDDVTALELEEFVKKLKPDLVGSGIKEKYVFEKMGLPFRQMHSWDYSGPYHGYEGFPIFARDMDMAINSPTWKSIKAPWSK